MVLQFSKALPSNRGRAITDKQSSKLSGRVTRVDRQHHGMSLTAEEALAQIELAAAKKSAKKAAMKVTQKAKQTANKRRGRPKKLTNDEQANTVLKEADETVINGVELVQTSNSIKSCFKCHKSFDLSTECSTEWRACESCSNWCCDKCLPRKFTRNSTNEFFCSKNCVN